MSENSLPVRLIVEGRRAILEVSRPEALNALNEEVLVAIENFALELSKRRDIDVVILQGSGEKAFVAGADIRAMVDFSASEAERFSILGSRAFAAIEALPQVVVARVQGFALGGGLELALSADIILASTKARFGFPEVSLGLVPGFGGTQRFARRVGVSRAMEWIVTGEKYSAEQAMAIGLVNALHSPEDLDVAVNRLVDSILAKGPLAVREAKTLVRRASDVDLATGCRLESAIFGIRFDTPEAKEGMRAFLEKRTPRFG
jgi:enoyl-CoA hydratase